MLKIAWAGAFDTRRGVQGATWVSFGDGQRLRAFQGHMSCCRGPLPDALQRGGVSSGV